MEFIPLFFQEKLSLVNPRGVIGVVTLWSRVDYVQQRFRQAGVELDAAKSPIAGFGTLYGNGLRELLRNLLYNPQIQVLLICGRNRSGSLEELQKFFDQGLEPGDSKLVSYQALPSGEEVHTCRIRGTGRLIDSLVRPELFTAPPQLVWLGEPQDPATLERIGKFFATWQARPALSSNELKRQAIPLPQVAIAHFPSNPRGHTVVRDSPLAAWKELLFILSRFGHLVSLKKGERIELSNVKAVVEQPVFEPEESLQAHHFDPEHLRRYQAEILKGEKEADETYNYGHRLRQYFGLDGLQACIQRLQADPEDRKAYLVLWDNRRDLEAPEGHPCLVSLFFRRFEEKLTLTATFRTHNAMDAWLINFYGLMAVQQYVAQAIALPPGAITVISHSISIDRRELDRALEVVGRRPFELRTDPCGYFRISLDQGEIVVEHRWGDVTLATYRSDKARQLQHRLARDLALSDLNHALYLGRQLARAEQCLQNGQEFIQE
ncbi:MAG: thymidylate synthase [Desulfobacteraceae bacterium]